jgi:hypothetical protein
VLFRLRTGKVCLVADPRFYLVKLPLAMEYTVAPECIETGT